MKEFYKILLIGSSGQGKTYSTLSLPEKTTAFINVENKPLPEPKNFATHAKPTTAAEVISSIVQAAKDPQIEVIVIDSFSEYMDIVLREARATKKGLHQALLKAI